VDRDPHGLREFRDRFKVFTQDGVARNPYEKLEDAAQVHRFTGVTPSVALHIPGTGSRTRSFASTRRARSTDRAINPNVFQEADTGSAASVTGPEGASEGDRSPP